MTQNCAQFYFKLASITWYWTRTLLSECHGES